VRAVRNVYFFMREAWIEEPKTRLVNPDHS
jgi:hypothetical protein